ncbi:hypothetical protein OsI_08487 [Oryza sativa Indica Group]|uniref:Uncharacterized protein n=2 Tax=Oryza TaxID=4527 RepID=B8AGQ4_ORYSI|nr:hypothetical protein OsI_08487 [Oryza sativa Indica Group]
MASAPSTGFDGDGDRIGTYARFSGPKLRGLRIWPQYHLIYRTKRGRHNHVASVARSPDLTSGNGKTQRQCSTMKSFKGLVRPASDKGPLRKPLEGLWGRKRPPVTHKNASERGTLKEPTGWLPRHGAPK